MTTEEYVPAGSEPGWYRHPTQECDYYYTGRGFGTVDGSYVRRRHPQNGPDFEPMDSAGVSEWIRQHGADFAIPRSRIVTLDHVPGHRVRDVLGLVTPS